MEKPPMMRHDLETEEEKARHLAYQKFNAKI